MGAFDLTIGCLLFASWANMILYTVQCLQTYHYFTSYPRDGWFNQGSVILALASDFMTVFAGASSVYLYTVTHWGSETYIQTQPWCFPAYIIGTAITATVVQVWLTRMVWNLTHQWFWLPLIAASIITGLIGAAATAGHTLLDSSYDSRAVVVKYVTISLAACAVADAIITGVLVWKFRTIKTSFTDTKDLLRRLSIAAVRNGSITTVVALVTLVVFKIDPQTNVAPMLEMTIGRIYSISMLSNLNNRTSSANGSQGTSLPKSTGVSDAPTALRIRQDVETHYQSDADGILMRGTSYRGKADLESRDGQSDRDVNLVVHVEDNHEPV